VDSKSPMPRESAGPLRTPPFRLTVTAAIGKPLVAYLRKHLHAAHAILKPALAEMSLALVGDRAMADLHQRFMDIMGPTDVLTFPLDEDDAGHAVSGEVVVCVTEARRRSKQEGTDFREEVLLYALHGMLHLCGFDDQTDAAYRRMHRTEDDILAKIGVGAVFASQRVAPKSRHKLKTAHKPRLR
jgi:rRNA maturation RNase YbeY